MSTFSISITHINKCMKSSNILFNFKLNWIDRCMHLIQAFVGEIKWKWLQAETARTNAQCTHKHIHIHPYLVFGIWIPKQFRCVCFQFYIAFIFKNCKLIRRNFNIIAKWKLSSLLVMCNVYWVLKTIQEKLILRNS